jgi:hypothetical protein
MMQNKQRIVIANWMGWTVVTANAWGEPMGYNDNLSGELKIIPNYPNDLNAMHEAENGLSEDKIFNYSHNLYNVVVPQSTQPFRATAQQRSEALCRTLWP